MSKLSPEQVRSLKEDVDEMLSYAPKYFIWKWKLDESADRIHDALEEYAKLLEEIQIGVDILQIGVDILFDDAALYPASGAERSTGDHDGKNAT